MRLPEAIDTPLRTAVGLLVLPAALVFYAGLGMVRVLLGAPPTVGRYSYLGFARVCMRIARTRVEVHGQERVRPGQAYIIVVNHESNWDTPAMLAALRFMDFRFIAKNEIMRLPIIGHGLRLTGSVRVVRSQTVADVQRINEAMDQRIPGMSILFFAEGSRQRDGAFRAFKMGAFATALNYGLPVLPVGIAGTHAIWPKGKLRLRRGPLAVEIGEPIPVQGLDYEDRRVLRDHAHTAVAKLRTQARQCLRKQGVEPGGLD